jgi:hypothetical protein
MTSDVVVVSVKCDLVTIVMILKCLSQVLITAIFNKQDILRALNVLL